MTERVMACFVSEILSAGHGHLMKVKVISELIIPDECGARQSGVVRRTLVNSVRVKLLRSNPS
jgi:hypothetical protein